MSATEAINNVYFQVAYPVNEAVIALGSSLDIIFHGGPAAWPRCNSHFVISEYILL